MNFKIHVSEKLVLDTDYLELAEIVFSYLSKTEIQPYRISTEHAALIVKDNRVYRRDRVNPDQLQFICKEDDYDPNSKHDPGYSISDLLGLISG